MRFRGCWQFDLDIGEEDLPDSFQPRMREMTFNLATGEASSRQLADVICEFPRVPDHLIGAHPLHACCEFCLTLLVAKEQLHSDSGLICLLHCISVITICTFHCLITT